MATKIVSVTELKARLAGLLDELVSERVPFHIVQHGKPRAVLVEYEEFEAMLTKIDDLEDILSMEEALSSPEAESMTLEGYDKQRTARLRG